MRLSRSLPAALALSLLCSSFTAPPARAADTGPIKIAVITDMSGVYAALAGAGAVEATKMAVEDFGGKVLGRPIQVEAIDHRNNGPEAAIKAREAYDGGAELALDMTNSAVALAVAGVAKEKHKLAIVTGGASSALTGASCNRYTYHYAYDTYALANSTGTNIAAGSGGKTWYGLVPNYAFGTQMLADFTAAVERKGGKMQASDLYPFPATTDF
ncbi:MAG TPA: ABC transporter substrate-binding protein, partial [Candidatus Limnocylindrales bacterium]|nr:ABC transporter substrate-binding protein [Candidatus Limnocylindrales bacterium]